MALIRILVDGYSLLHNWPELAPGKARHSEAARDELISVLTQYQDAAGAPLTIVFDGSRPRRGPAAKPSPKSEIEVLFSAGRQSADDLIERAVVRFREYGDVLVVTDDFAERDTVFFNGGLVTSCANFINDVERALNQQEREIAHHNRREKSRFKTTS